uniref:transposase n=1 Tax=Corynebacterium variabile TaxID=1727 RepID=UPI0035E3F0B7
MLGQTLWRRRADILAYFDTGASNGPVENFNGKLEYLRGIALGSFEQGQLHLAATDLLGRTPGGDQRTLKPEEPVFRRVPPKPRRSRT